MIAARFVNRCISYSLKSPHLTKRAAAMLGVCLMVVGLPAAVHAQSEAVEYYGLDALGSVRVVFDANGNLLGRMDYGPFGQELVPSTATRQNVYAGLFVDGAARMHHAAARSFQERTGRFSSVDPIYDGLFEPQSWNRYSYSLNNPLTFTDPAGLNVISSSNPGCSTFPNDSYCSMEVWMAWWRYFGGDSGGGSTETNEDYGNVGSAETGVPSNPEPPPNESPTSPNPPGGPPPGLPPGPSNPPPAPLPPTFGSCFNQNFGFAWRSANLSWANLAVAAGANSARKIPSWSQWLPGIPTNIRKSTGLALGVGGAVARATGLTNVVMGVPDLIRFGGVGGIMGARATIISMGVNSAVTGFFVGAAFEAGVTVGSAAYATGQALVRQNCR